MITSDFSLNPIKLGVIVILSFINSQLVFVEHPLCITVLGFIHGIYCLLWDINQLVLCQYTPQPVSYWTSLFTWVTLRSVLISPEKKKSKTVSDHLYILLTPKTLPCTVSYVFSKNIWWVNIPGVFHLLPSSLSQRSNSKEVCYH